MKYVIYGAGAIGGSLAAHMIEHGREVVLVDRDADHVEAINRDGLRLVGLGSEITVKTRAVTPEQVDFPLDQVLLSVKSQHTADAMAVIAPRLTHNGFVLSLQNGLNEYEIARHVGEHRVIGALVNWAADYISPGVIQFGGASNFVIGELSGQISTRVSGLVEDLRGVFDAESTNNILGFLWSKQISLGVLFVTGITPLKISDCLDTVQFEPALSTVAAEGVSLANLHGVTLEILDDFEPELYRQGRVREALTLMADHYRPMIKQHTGLYRDLAVRKRPSEIEGTIGMAIDLGTTAGLEMPAHRKLKEMVLEIEKGIRPISVDNIRELADNCLFRSRKIAM